MVQLIDHNFNLHARKIAEQTKGMKVITLENLCYVDSGLLCDTFNIIHIFNGRHFPEKELMEAVNHFRNKYSPFCIWINKENLTPPVKKTLAELSLIKQNEEIGMSLDLDSFYPIDNQGHEHITTVNSKNMLLEYAQVIAENWTPIDENILKYYERTADKYLNKENNIYLLIYYYKNKAAATVELFPTDKETLGLYGFSTLEKYRGMGIGSSLFTFALNKVKKMGFKKVILQASEDGFRIYKKYGFENYTVYYEYA